MSHIKVLSYNIRSLNNKIKQKCFISQIHKLNPDILLVQETHLRNNTNRILNDKRFNYQVHSQGSSEARGTAILINRTLQFKEIQVLKDKERRLISTKGILNGQKVTISSIYAPNDNQLQFLEDSFRKHPKSHGCKCTGDHLKIIIYR